MFQLYNHHFLIINLSSFLYIRNTIQYYKIGALTLPQNGNQAVIQVNLCYGYNFNPLSVTNLADYNIQNYKLDIHLYSANGSRNASGTYFGSSRSVDPGSGAFNAIYYTTGIFHNGFVVSTSPLVKPLGVLLGRTSDPLNSVDIWIQSYMWHGKPLIQVSQSDGSFTKNFSQLNAMPLTGYANWIYIKIL